MPLPLSLAERRQFGDQLRRCRKANDETQGALAQRTGLTLRRIHVIENASAKARSKEVAALLAALPSLRDALHPVPLPVAPVASVPPVSPAPPPATLDQLPEILRVPEVAAYCKITRGMVYQLTNSGALPHVKFGRHVRISREALRKYIEGNR